MPDYPEDDVVIDDSSEENENENSNEEESEESVEILTTDYSVIYGRFLSKIEDNELVKMQAEDRRSMLKEWLITALSYIELDKLTIENDLTDRDDDEEIFNSELTPAEIEGIALYMVVAWYENKVNSLEHTLLFMGSKDEKWTNQKDHWKVTVDTQRAYRLRARKYFRNHSSRDNAYIYPERYTK